MMGEFTLHLDDLDDDLGEFEGPGSANSESDKVDSILIKKILYEMKSEFNKATGNANEEKTEPKEKDDEEEETIQDENVPEVQERINKNNEEEEERDEEVKEKGGVEEEKEDKEDETVENEKEHEELEEKVEKEEEEKEEDEEKDEEEEKDDEGKEEEEEKERRVEEEGKAVEDSNEKDEKEEELEEKVLSMDHVEGVSMFQQESKEETDSSQTATVIIEEPPKKRKRTRRTRQSVDLTLISDEPLEKRTRRHVRYSERFEEMAVKRSSRRTSKDFSRESVLQNAIARKEKSFSSLNPPDDKPQRRSTRLHEEPHRPQRKSIKTRSQGDSETYGTDLKRGSRATSEGSDLDDSSVEDFRHHRYSQRSMTGRHKEPNNSNILEDDQYSISEDVDAKPKIRETGNGMVVKHHPLLHSEWLQNRSELCECESLTIMRPSQGSLQLSDMCQAVDSFDDKFYICCNPIAAETVLLRPSKRTPYMQLCQLHIQRLFGHNACPPCGTFCTQGIFNICINHHVFHNDCTVSKEVFTSCPHCSTDKFALHRLRMENHKYPLFLPIQKPINRERMARISLQYGEKLNKPKSREDKILHEDSLLLSNGRVITAEGIPLPEIEQLKHYLKQPIGRSDVRYTYRNLYQAAKAGDVEKILIMIAEGMNPNREPGCLGALHAAAGSGFLAAVHILVQAGTNLDTLDKGQFTPLMAATLNGHNHIVRYLVKAGASLTVQGVDGMTALHFAAKLGNVEACHIMLTLISTPDSLVNIVDDGRWTALVWAAENRHSKVVRYLLENRADPHVRDGEMNIALHWSAYSGSMEITEDLLNYGSNINLSNAHGDTPLHIAARQSADECVTLLLARGARVDMMNKAGLTAKDCVINPDSYCLTIIELNLKINNIRLKFNSFPRILSNDISRGRENYPIQCINAVDDDPMPTNYTYITQNCFTSNITIDRTITSLDPCKCDDMCYTSGCMCGKISRKCWYDNKGKLSSDFNFEDPPMLFECSEACNCNIMICKNRVVQKGIKVKLQMVKTKDKSWAVITLCPIPKGSYVCEYVGEIISDCEADTREDDSYLFDLDNRDGGESYCLDARKYGNITRFINHSCLPNLSPVRVFIGHRDLHFPRIAMFAARDIEPYEELGYDYGEKFWVIKGKSFTCKCKEEMCKYSEDTIHETLERYNERMEMEESLT
ncbi:histone-lysine N-methyltransferase EHMT2 [Cimex lectularius]|uniref:Uncharacterized protein n=1 Tax=Cimex lectularius TaxID=79782 RepID=A0A8I6RP85_CIMLE|nr:histone-lysine N-methyltransferase EHMT2 [Cimex lectularius]XP_014249023.1 histone-lysine N-methyltransferase EHMT2 [Cimex lectularius]